MELNYPKTSCNCFYCNKSIFPKPIGVATNSSVRGCQFSPYYECHDRSLFKTQVEPVKDFREYIILNRDVISKDKFDCTFREINPKICKGSSCKNITYISSDPRLYNAATADWLQLDRPPLITYSNIDLLSTNKELNNYGQNYRSYQDINAGQILYYIPRDIEDSFFEPNFSEKAAVIGTLYKDPMDNMKPEYTRIPKSLNCFNRQCETGNYCLSFINDTQYQREDILSKQLTIPNQQKYSARWTNEKMTF